MYYVRCNVARISAILATDNFDHPRLELLMSARERGEQFSVRQFFTALLYRSSSELTFFVRQRIGTALSIH